MPNKVTNFLLRLVNQQRRAPQKSSNVKKIIKNIDDTNITVREIGQISRREIKNPSISQITKELEAGVCTVFFYKIKNGDYRRMTCTLKDHTPALGPSKWNKPGVVVVWDMEHDNWRSFYANRVTMIIRDEETDAQ